MTRNPSSGGAFLHENPWAELPPEVVKYGWTRIVSCYEGLELSGAAPYNTLKVVLVGAVCAGKTTLAKGLLKGKPAPTTEGERTRGVDVHIEQWKPNPDQPLDVVIWDFAGHADYHSTHQVRHFLR